MKPALEPQTDSFTEVRTAPPVFCLKASDISSPITIKLWVKINERIRLNMRNGMSVLEVARAVELYYDLDWMDLPDDPKLLGALGVAAEMELVSGRKLAD